MAAMSSPRALLEQGIPSSIEILRVKFVRGTKWGLDQSRRGGSPSTHDLSANAILVPIQKMLVSRHKNLTG